MLFRGLVGVNKTLVDLVALGIDNACPCLVARFEADLVGESSNLLFVEDAAILVTVLDALFFRDDREIRGNRRGALGRWGDCCLALVLLYLLNRLLLLVRDSGGRCRGGRCYR